MLNGFLQTLIGLYDYSHISGDHDAARLFAAGDAEARAEVPHYRHRQLVAVSAGHRVYCATAARFDAYAKNPPH